MKLRTKVLATVGVAAAMVIGSPPAGADAASLQVSPNPVHAGEDLAVSGEGCGVGDVDGTPVVEEARVLISVALDGADDAAAVGTAFPDDEGSWAATLAIPATTTPDPDYVVHARCVLDYTGYSGLPTSGAARASRAAPTSFDYEPVILEILPPRAVPADTTTTEAGRVTPTGGGGRGGGSGSGSDGPLPRTGTSLALLLAVGSGLVAVGAGAEVVSRRRRGARG